MSLAINKISAVLGLLAVLQPANCDRILDFVAATKEGSKVFDIKPKYDDFDEIDLQKGRSGSDSKKRDGDYESTNLDFESILYSLPLEIGSNKQQVTVQVDTGSSDLWVTEEDWDGNCEEAKFKCTTSGFFDPSKSSSFVNNDTFFNISYLGGYGVEGHYGFDTVIIGDDIELPDFPFAVGEESTAEMAGIFGIGLPHGEALYSSEGITYENFAFQLVKNGITESAAYSIGLAPINDDNDSDFLLGAVDHGKYSGDFLRFPISPVTASSQLLSHVAVTLNEFYVGAAASLDDNDNIDSIVKAPIYTGSSPVLLDTGATVANLPQSIITRIAYQFDFTYDSSSGYYLKYCDEITSDYFVGVNVQGLDLTVPLFYLLESYESDTGAEICVLNIAPSNVLVLGDNFLRGLYMSVDLQNNEIALGNANLNPNATSSEDDIEVVSDTIPASTNELYSSTYDPSLTGTLYPTTAQLTTLYSASAFPTYYSDIYDVTLDEESGSFSETDDIPSGSNTGSSNTSSRRSSGSSASSSTSTRSSSRSSTSTRSSSRSSTSNSPSSRSSTSTPASSDRSSAGSSSSTGNGATTASRGEDTPTTSASSAPATSANAGSSNSVKYSALAFMLVNFFL
ncbi:unnamed protein product [[Candida] boidinii]|uniref:Unnamed protein product n=1 Tax=Candida boidinii TaxID=5477 RepID=A0ACB5TIX4_CANBO|nr:unnamed protein product [[Candida] boidinii]